MRWSAWSSSATCWCGATLRFAFKFDRSVFYREPSRIFVPRSLCSASPKATRVTAAEGGTHTVYELGERALSEVGGEALDAYTRAMLLPVPAKERGGGAPGGSGGEGGSNGNAGVGGSGGAGPSRVRA